MIAVITLFVCSKMNAQNTARKIDSALARMAADESRFDHVSIGKTVSKETFFYHKSDKKIYSIVISDHRMVNKKLVDSPVSTVYFFIEDRLVRIRIQKRYRRHIPEELIYFENDKLLADKSGKNYSAQQINDMIARAYGLLASGQIRIRQKFTDP